MEGDGSQVQGHRKLRARQTADDLAVQVFEAVHQTPAFPSWLRAQMARAAISVPANLVEGYSRGGLRDYLRFLDIRGSLGELEYYTHFATRLHLLDQNLCARLSELTAETGRFLFGLRRSLAKKELEGGWDRSRGDKEEASTYSVDEPE